MAHTHEVYDTDRSFSIDPITRSIIKDTENHKVIIVQHDHLSEELTFKLPKTIEGHDMSLCNEVEVHYINKGSLRTEQEIGIYTVEDLGPDPNDSEYLTCTWKVSHRATHYAGALHFAIRFACVTNGAIEYSWNTIPYIGITIAPGIYNDEILDDYVDILEQWEIRLLDSMIASITQTTTSTENGGVNILRITQGGGSQTDFEVRNGTMPVKGEDYWTEEDKTQMIEDVLEDLHYGASGAANMAIYVDTEGVLNVAYTVPATAQVGDLVFTVTDSEDVTVTYEEV